MNCATFEKTWLTNLRCLLEFKLWTDKLVLEVHKNLSNSTVSPNFTQHNIHKGRVLSESRS